MARRKTNAAIEPQHQEPPIQAAELVVEEREKPRWPEIAGPEEKNPKWVVKQDRRRIFCPQCRWRYLEDGGHAIACLSSGSDMVWYRCKHCGNRFKLPVKKARGR